MLCACLPHREALYIFTPGDRKFRMAMKRIIMPKIA
jgi:hypothetical protein